jgi:hypothetical protein
MDAQEVRTMARFLAIHSPIDPEDQTVHAPTKMTELARNHGGVDASPRWLRAWSPDLDDDRIFTLWDAQNAVDIKAALSRFGFLDHMQTQTLRVQEWGPAEVLEVDDSPS